LLVGWWKSRNIMTEGQGGGRLLTSWQTGERERERQTDRQTREDVLLKMYSSKDTPITYFLELGPSS
jgi:hypothetical protein